MSLTNYLSGLKVSTYRSTDPYGAPYICVGNYAVQDFIGPHGVGPGTSVARVLELLANQHNQLIDTVAKELEELKRWAVEMRLAFGALGGPALNADLTTFRDNVARLQDLVAAGNALVTLTAADVK